MANAVQQKKNLMAALGAVNKAYGAGTIALASQVAFAHLTRIPTGIFSLDMEIGGGLPKGRFTMVVGEEATAKTTLFLFIAANFQHTCRKCLSPFQWYTDEEVDPATGEILKQDMVVTEACACGANEPHTVALFDSEGHFDPMWAASLGVDVPTLIVIQPQHAEQGVDVVNKLLRTGELDLVGIDSVAMMTPGVEVEESAEKMTVGSMARIWNKAMRTFQASLNSLGMNNPNKPAIYMVNQFREKVGVMYGDPTTWPGGKGQNFASSIIISMRRGKAIDQNGNVGGKDDTKVGSEFFFKTEKNKVFPPLKKGSFKLYSTDVPALGVRKGSVNNFEQMMGYAVKLGVIKQSGAWYDLTSTFGDAFKNPLSKNGTFQGLDSVVSFLQQDKAKVKTVSDRILAEVKMQNRGALPSSGDEPEVVDLVPDEAAA